MTEVGTLSQVSLSVGADLVSVAAAVTPTLAAALGLVAAVDDDVVLPACVAVGPGEKPGHVSRGTASGYSFVHASIVETFHA